MDRQSHGVAAGDQDHDSPKQSEVILRDLRRKLDDLEDKVQAYRRDIAAEFQRHYEQTLLDTNMPRDTVLAVQKSLAMSLENCYPVLAPELRTQIPAVDSTSLESTSHSGASSGKTLESPSSASAGLRPSPPSSGAVFGAAVASPGSPHEREKEFQGLFTPFFLPLLDSNPVSLANSPASTSLQTGARSEPSAAGSATADRSTTSPPLAKPTVTGSGPESAVGANVATADQMQGSSRHLQGQDMEGSSETGALQSGRTGTSQPASPSPAASPSPLPGRPAAHARQSTDDTLSSALSSALSDKSESSAPKSALRRSSSCSRPPQQSPRRVRFEVKGAEVLPTASPQPSDFPTPRPSSPASADQPRSFDEIVGGASSNEDDRPSLPPRKISSTEKLRLLSREPLDASTTWTTVNMGPEDSDGSNPSVKASPVSTPVPASPEPAIQAGIGKPFALARKEESEESSDEDFLAMAKPKSKIKKAAPTPAVEKAPRPEPPTKPGSPGEKLAKEEEEKDQTSSEDYEEEDDMFHFESGGLSAPPRPKKRPPPLKEDMPELSTPEPEIDDEVRTSQIMSPGVAIPAQTGSGPPTPTASRFQIGSLGSYKGRPVVMPVVKNPELHAQAAQQGDFNTFVGGVDGRSGVDDGDMNSFRASLAPSVFSGTPRSLSERMMMEDAMEEKKIRS